MRTDLEQLRAVLDAIPGYVSWISSDLVYLGVNEGLARANNMSPSEFLGKEIGFVGGASSGFTKLIKDFFASKAEHVSSVMPVKFALSGEDAWYSFSLSKYDSGSKAVVVGIDVTELKKAQAIIEEQRLQIASSSKMSALGEMAASVTHELSSPLTVISGFADYLKFVLSKPTFDQREILDLIEKIITAANHASVTIDGFRRFSRDGSRDPFEMTPVRQIIDNALILCREKFKIRQIDLRSINLDSDLRVPCQATQIVQVLLNLFNNAIDAVEEFCEEDQRWVGIELVDRGAAIEIRVRDSGPGIPPAVRSQIMQPFYTTKPAGKGTGIGLTISRRIMEAHQGTLTLDSGQETCFIVMIPKTRSH